MSKSKISKDPLKRLESTIEYTVEEIDQRNIFFIGGLIGSTVFESKADAEAVAAALNIAKHWKKMQRRAELLNRELSEFIR